MNNMSSEELPVELDKLKIAPTLPQIKFLDNQIPIILNPFYHDNLPPAVSNSESLKKIEKNAAFRRRFRFRRRSESFLDNMKGSNSNTSEQHENSCGRSIQRVQKNSLKKTSNNGLKKTILREPVLSTFHQKLCIKKLSNKSFPDDENVNFSKHTPTNLSGETNSCDLIQNLNIATKKLEIGSRSQTSKNFTTLQSKESKHCGESLETTSCSHTRHTLSSIKNQHKTNPSKIRSNISCSQQAGSSSVNSCDDVTINELASYFDTMVHIPKKMSTMAEMMYI